MKKTYQNIIIGAGHNGLVCAAYLARAGQSVLVLEADSLIGGAARTRELSHGAKISSGAHLLHAMPADLIRELNLTKHGLVLSAKNLKTIALNAQAPASAIVFDGDNVSGTHLSAGDIESYARFNKDMQRFAKTLRPVFDKLAPSLVPSTWRQALELMGLGFALRRLRRFYMREILRIIGLNFYDLLDEYFSSPELKATIAMDALWGGEWGARSMGGVLTYLYRLAGYERSGSMGLALPQGGMGGLSESIARAAATAGATITTNARVKRILIENDKAIGVELDSGEQLFSPAIISNADPKQTFLKLVDIDHLDTGFVRQIDKIRSKGRAAKLHILLEGLPDFTGVAAADLGSRIIIAPTMDDIELAFNPCKYNRYPSAPVLEIVIPSICDPSLVSANQHILSAVVQYLPYDDSPDEDANRESFLQTTIDLLETYAPGIRSLISHAELLTPRDIEKEFGNTGGHWHHVPLTFEYFLFNRPIPKLSRHTSPIAGLYLCGAGCHPGGNVMGIAGRNAAQQVLKGGL